MRTPKDLKPGDNCYLVSRDGNCQILTVNKVELSKKGSAWISFEEPVPGAFCTSNVKEFIEVNFGKKMFFDKERALTYLNQKLEKLKRIISKVEKK